MWKVTSAELVRSVHEPRDFLRDGRPEIAFVGRSNVGKSSLINKLLGRKKLARTSSTPGRTRSVNYFLINRQYYLVDLPGYGWAKAGKGERRKWAATVDAYFAHPADRRVVLLIDGKVGATSLDVQAAEYLREQLRSPGQKGHFEDEEGLSGRLIVAVTKIDRVPRHKRSESLARIREHLQFPEEVKVLGVSARTGEGIAELRGGLTPRS